MMLSNFVFYCLLYLFSGFILIMYIVIQAYIRKNINFCFKKIFKDIIFYCICILIWPLIFIVILYGLYDGVAFSKKSEKPEIFVLKFSDLLEKITRCEVELREIVCDPLNAAPSIPFGHLNSVWLEFCEGLEPQDELWTFDLLWDGPWGQQIRYSGYAAVKNNDISSVFYTI